MPFRDPIYKLILPPGATPPTTGQSIIVLDPGPPPAIQLYTGLAAEKTPASLTASESAGIPRLIIAGPDTTATAFGPAFFKMGIDNGASPESFVELFTEDFTVYDNSAAVKLLALKGTNSFDSPIVPYADIVRFKTLSTSMMDAFVSSSTDNLTQNNTAYAAPANSVGLTFKAPPSGRGLVTWRGRADANFSAAAGVQIGRSVWCAPQLRNGASIGAGTDPNLLEAVASPTDDIAAGWGEFATGPVVIGMPPVTGIAHVSGLTFNNDYNLQLRWRCNSATTFTYDILHQMIGFTPLP